MRGRRGRRGLQRHLASRGSDLGTHAAPACRTATAGEEAIAYPAHPVAPCRCCFGRRGLLRCRGHKLRGCRSRARASACSGPRCDLAAGCWGSRGHRAHAPGRRSGSGRGGATRGTGVGTCFAPRDSSSTRSSRRRTGQRACHRDRRIVRLRSTGASPRLVRGHERVPRSVTRRDGRLGDPQLEATPRTGQSARSSRGLLVVTYPRVAIPGRRFRRAWQGRDSPTRDQDRDHRFSRLCAQT